MPAAPFHLVVDWNNDGDYSDSNEDVTARVRTASGLSFWRGHNQLQPFSPPAIGSCGFELDNSDAVLSPTNVSSPLYGYLAPGKPVKCYADGLANYLLLEKSGGHTKLEDGSGFVSLEDSPSRPIWTGFTDEQTQHPELGRRSVDIAGRGTLTRLQNKTISTPLYSNISTSTALGYVLDAAGWPASERSIAAGTRTLEWFWVDNENAADAINRILYSEGPNARLYESPDGWLVFEANNTRTSTQDRSTTSQATYSDLANVMAETYDPNYKSVVQACVATVNTRAAQACSPVWSYGQTLTLGANASQSFTVRGSDPFTGAIVPSPVPSNATQVLTPSATLTSGTFQLSFKGSTTSAIAYNATAATIQAALEALSTIGSGNVVCSGGPINTTPVVCVFIGTLGGAEIDDLISVTGSTLNPVTVPATIEVQENHAGGGLYIESQSLAPSGPLNGGSFTITASYSLGAGTTSSIAYNASAATIQAALRAMPGFTATSCYGGPINSAGVLCNFADVAENMALVTITTSGLTMAQPSATVNISQSDKGGVADYVLTSGSLASKTLDRTSGAFCTLTLTAGASGATLTGLRVRACPVSVVTSTEVSYPSLSAVSDPALIQRPGVVSEMSVSSMTALMTANYNYWKQARPVVVIRTVTDCYDASALDVELRREISDRITINIPAMGLSADFFVEWVRRTVDWPVLICEYGCEQIIP
jgi:hypothetical protein